ncbi:MAG: tRNA pseudouridine(38-40) synthase TruA [Clostridia bacterium]|nr:tRNA pseudouridine(38-40) synthase TruA [Clostridia bacterium]MBQ3869978.1 tRNA pseudouridine(38-40) synthase TruA [Clostridia bacterium]
MNYLLELSYSGVKYSGFQIQKNAKTVAGELTRAAGLLFGCPCKINGCSRTDAGVHANQYFAAVNLSGDGNNVPVERIPAAINCLLPYDIAVKSARIVDDGYNPRFEAVCKEYKYIIYNSPYKNPFYHKLKLPYGRPLDAEALDREAKDFIGSHDFSAFMASGSDVVSTVRNVFSADVKREGDDVIFTVSADGFLYNMVRIMTGTLLYIAEGKIEPGSIPEIINGKNRSKAGITVSADGLYLNKVVLR